MLLCNIETDGSYIFTDESNSMLYNRITGFFWRERKKKTLWISRKEDPLLKHISFYFTKHHVHTVAPTEGVKVISRVQTSHLMVCPWSA